MAKPASEPRYFAKDGVVRERSDDETTSKIVVSCTPYGLKDRRFGCPVAASHAERIAAAMNQWGVA